MPQQGKQEFFFQVSEEENKFSTYHYLLLLATLNLLSLFSGFFSFHIKYT